MHPFAFHSVCRSAYAQRATWADIVATAPTLNIGSTDPKDNKAHGYALHASDRDSYPTNIACARTRHGSSNGSGHPSSDPEARKKPGSWQVARPSERKSWCGNQEQDQTGRTRPSRSHAGTGLARRVAT